MMEYAESMEQVALYWAPMSPDGFGGWITSDPVQVRCRWQDSQSLSRDSQSREAVSDTIVYTAFPVVARGFLLLGDGAGADLTDPREVSGAREVRQVQRSPDLSGEITITKVVL